VKVSEAECAMAAASVPRVFRLNTYVCADVLFTVTVNGAPALVGTIVGGAIVQFAGAPVPQLRATVLA